LSLSENVAARESEIHGKGVFALKRIRPGSFIGAFEGRVTETDGTYVLWLIDEHGVEIGFRGENDLRFLNHSKQPNTEFEDLRLYAVRNIQPGTELTLDYGEAWNDLA
jgi:SET domain-containing protein